MFRSEPWDVGGCPISTCRYSLPHGKQVGGERFSLRFFYRLELTYTIDGVLSGTFDLLRKMPFQLIGPQTVDVGFRLGLAAACPLLIQVVDPEPLVYRKPIEVVLGQVVIAHAVRLI